MPKDPAWLLDFKHDLFSQSGEDGIIGKILQIIPETDNWCVEFGAWDGMHLSNSRNLIENNGYSAVLIEGSRIKASELQRNYSSRKNIVTLNAFVGFGLNDNLDVILAATPAPKNFDFLSIDVDGNDCHIWKAMSKYRPKAVCIEFNPTIPTEVRFVQPADPSVSQGASLLSLVELGREKGYELVSVTRLNAIFVDSQYYGLFEIDDNRPQTLRKDLAFVTHLFSGYDGTMFLQGNGRLPWHGIPIREEKIQQLPKFLRKFPANYNLLRKAAFKILKRFIPSP